MTIETDGAGLEKSGQVLSTSQAAGRLGIDQRNVRRLCELGRLRASRLGRRAWAILETDLEVCLAARRLSRDRRIHGISRVSCTSKLF